MVIDNYFRSLSIYSASPALKIATPRVRSLFEQVARKNYTRRAYATDRSLAPRRAHQLQGGFVRTQRTPPGSATGYALQCFSFCNYLLVGAYQSEFH